jgi:hypothetical protein
MSKFFGNRLLKVMAPEGDGGGGGGDKGDKGKGDPAPDHAKEIADLKAANADLAKKLEKYSKPDPKPEDDPELIDKTRKEKAAADKKVSDSKALESALRFSLKSEEFLKTNATLLPKDVADIFKQAEKENYADAMEKDAAIKSGIIQSFFQVQANMDLLTPGLKSQLDEYLKLTKTGKQEKAQQIYDSVFEPAFAMLKGIKKAEALNKGFGGGSDAETAYKNKLMAGTRKHYLGEKSDGS